MGDPMEKQRQKQAFLAIIKWCSRETGAKIVFDIDDGQAPRANIETRTIHMPKRISVASSDAVLATLIHEAMHIKHTPRWLSDLCRDSLDHYIFNGLEDCRIETIAVGQLKALTFFLRKMVYDAKRRFDRSQSNLGQKVILNIACKASGLKICDDRDTWDAENKHKQLISDLRDIYRRIFTVSIAKSFKSNVTELYVKLDEFRRVFNMPDPPPEEEEQKKQDGNGVGGEDARAQITAQRVKEIETAIKEMAVAAGKTPGSGCGNDLDSLDLSELGCQTIDLNEQARARIKESLKKSMTEIIDEGTTLNSDNLVSLLTGDIDDVFTDTKSEKKMRTKVYFLMDVSGSMRDEMSLPDLEEITGKSAKASTRQHVATAAFKAISEVMDEAKDMYGVDLDYENFMFADSCYKVNKMGEMEAGQWCGGGTNLAHAFKVVMNRVHQDDPANKRIVCILTDGEVGNVDAIREQIAREAQDIRIVFVGIGEANVHCRALIRHNITSPDTAEAILIDSFEEAL